MSREDDRRTAFDASWRALFRPGETDSYFQFDHVLPVEAPQDSFRPETALWLAELARLVYQPCRDTRCRALRAAGLTEIASFSAGSTQGNLVAGDSFAALVFRGTSEPDDWRTNLDSLREEWHGGGSVHQGFGAALLSVWSEVEELLNRAARPLFLCGHSLGGALAQLAASLSVPDAVYTFGSPRVGDRSFAKALARLPVFRVVNRADIVATLPPSVAGYKHAGRLQYLTGHGDIVTDAPKSRIYGTRFSSMETLLGLFESAPAHLADHAPVNYVAGLLRCLLGPGREKR